MRRSVALVAGGVALGLPGAFAVSQLLTGFLYAVKPGDPAALTLVAAVLIVAGVAAALVPARRAIRIQPVIALRYE